MHDEGIPDEERGERVQLLQIHPSDNVVVACQPLAAGQHIEVVGIKLTIPRDVSLGAKLAIQAIAPGEQVIKYGEPIGSATEAIRPGDYVHTHNLRGDTVATH